MYLCIYVQACVQVLCVYVHVHMCVYVRACERPIFSVKLRTLKLCDTCGCRLFNSWPPIPHGSCDWCVAVTYALCYLLWTVWSSEVNYHTHPCTVKEQNNTHTHKHTHVHRHTHMHAYMWECTNTHVPTYMHTYLISITHNEQLLTKSDAFQQILTQRCILSDN